jgi:hypothetical protein
MGLSGGAGISEIGPIDVLKLLDTSRVVHVREEKTDKEIRVNNAQKRILLRCPRLRFDWLQGRVVAGAAPEFVGHL